MALSKNKKFDSKKEGKRERERERERRKKLLRHIEFVFIVVVVMKYRQSIEWTSTGKKRSDVPT